VASASYSSYSSYGTTPAWCEVRDNHIKGGYYGIYWRGYSSSSTSSSYGRNNIFDGNTIDDFYVYGAYVYYGYNNSFTNNTVIQRTSSPYTTSSGYGLYAGYWQGNGEISNNYIWSRYCALRAYYTNYYGSGSYTIANNMLIGAGTSYHYLFYVYRNRNSKVYYNSVNVISGSSTQYIFYCYYPYSCDVKNNFIAHNTTSGSTVYLTYSYSYSSTTYDYNAFYSKKSNAQFYWMGSTYSWSSLPKTTYNSHSVWGEPYYVSNTDLHSRSHAGYQKGYPVSVADDYDGEPRSATAPCIGADEYPAPPAEYDMAVRGVLFDYAIDSWARLEAPREHTIRAVLENVGLKDDPSTLTVVYKLDGIPSSSSDGVSQTFTPAWSNHKAVVQFTTPLGGLVANTSPRVYVRSFMTNEQNVANDVNWDEHVVKDSKHYGFEDFNTMVAPYFSADPGYLDYKWSVVDNAGSGTFVVGMNGVGGSNAAEYTGDAGQADDWLVAPGTSLIASSSYRFEMLVRSVTGAPQTVELAFGDSPDPASMTVFATLSNFTNTNFMSLKELTGGVFSPYFNTPNSQQNYFVGIHVVSGGGAGAVAFDNLTLDANPSPPPKIGYGQPGADISQFIDDPAFPIQVTTNYKQPGLINRTYQVASTTDIYGMHGDFLWDVESTTPWITVTKEPADPTLQGYNFVPPRPRQFQTFTMTIDPSGLAPGVHMGQLAFYGILFNDDFRPPSNGLIATNEVLYVNVELRISNAGTASGPTSMSFTQSSPMTSAGNPYFFNDPATNELIAIVNVTSGQIDQMTIAAFPNQLPLNIARMRYVKRYWQISHTGTGWTAEVTFPYTDQEASIVTDKTQLRGIRQPMPAGGWEVPIMGTVSSSDPMNNMVTVMGLNEFNIGGNIALAHAYYLMSKSEKQPVTGGFSLEQNYPNPFNPATSISFSVGEDAPVRLAVYNSLGEQVAELVNETLAAGTYTVQFDGSALSSGTYMYRLTANGTTTTKYMTLSK
jgi:hypothetical protein